MLIRFLTDAYPISNGANVFHATEVQEKQTGILLRSADRGFGKA